MTNERSRIKNNPLDNLIKPQVEKENTAKKGLSDSYTRATIIVREDYLNTLKDLAYTDRKTIKDVFEDVMREYIENHVNGRDDLLKHK